MEQQTTPQPTTKAPTPEASATGVEGPKSKWWLWLIIAIVVIGAGIGTYFWLSL